jgi:hypothetical protein
MEDRVGLRPQLQVANLLQPRTVSPVKLAFINKSVLMLLISLYNTNVHCHKNDRDNKRIISSEDKCRNIKWTIKHKKSQSASSGVSERSEKQSHENTKDR